MASNLYQEFTQDSYLRYGLDWISYKLREEWNPTGLGQDTGLIRSSSHAAIHDSAPWGPLSRSFSFSDAVEVSISLPGVAQRTGRSQNRTLPYSPTGTAPCR